MKINQKLIPPLEAAGLVAYVTLVAYFLSHAEKWFGTQGNDMIGGIVFILLFVASALISASIMLGYPAMLFLKGKGKTALKIILQSIGWLVIFLLIILFAYSR
jgi:hypothetical protein